MKVHTEAHTLTKKFTQKPNKIKGYVDSKAVDYMLQSDLIKTIFFLKYFHNVLKVKL